MKDTKSSFSHPIFKEGFGLAQIKEQGALFEVDPGYVRQPGEIDEPCEERREIYISKTDLQEMLGKVCDNLEIYKYADTSAFDLQGFVDAFWNEMDPKP